MNIDGKEVMVEIEGQRFHCAMDVAMNYMGGKWKTVVLWYLIDQKRRFADFKRLVPHISDRMLSITLKQLEEDGLILREVHAIKPPLKVEYSLTDFGQSCMPLLREIALWGRAISKTKGQLVEIGADTKTT